MVPLDVAIWAPLKPRVWKGAACEGSLCEESACEESGCRAGGEGARIQGLDPGATALLDPA